MILRFLIYIFFLKVGCTYIVIQQMPTQNPYQGAAAEEDHEDNQGFKPVVLHDQVAGFPQEPPALAPAHRDVHVTALILGHTS